jgi:2-C-methyl-D-erythritol 4-phosphate cytidylyltransferase
MKKKIIAIVPAAGLGKRFSVSFRKPFVNLNGIPLLIHTLKRLHDVKSITEIIPVLRQQDIKRGFEMVKTYRLDKIKQIVPGGQERQDSVYNALKLLDRVDSYRESLILIHDGVRPLISSKLIEKLIKGIKGFDGVVPGIPVKETLKEVATDGIVISTVKREKFWTIQTPQIFPIEVIKKAYDRAHADGFYATDDAALVERIGGRVKIILGNPFNIKVTTPEDFDMIKLLLMKRDLLNGV